MLGTCLQLSTLATHRSVAFVRDGPIWKTVLTKSDTCSHCSVSLIFSVSLTLEAVSPELHLTHRSFVLSRLKSSWSAWRKANGNRIGREHLVLRINNCGRFVTSQRLLRAYKLKSLSLDRRHTRSGYAHGAWRGRWLISDLLSLQRSYAFTVDARSANLLDTRDEKFWTSENVGIRFGRTGLQYFRGYFLTGH